MKRLFAAGLVAALFGVWGTGAQALDTRPGFKVEMRAGLGDAFTKLAAPPAAALRALGPLDNAGATIVVTYTGFSPEARAAFQYAVDIWASTLSSSVTIRVNASWEPLPPGVLGAAGPWEMANWTGAPSMDTWYPYALADSLAGVDLDPSRPDIEALFSSVFPDWYFGTDGNTPSGKWDFVTVVLHELCHGLGFSGGASVSGGIGSVRDDGYGYPSVYSNFVENGSGAGILSFPDDTAAMGDQLVGGGGGLFFNGADAMAANGGSPVILYSPNPWEQGSSYAHYDEATFPPGMDGSLMTPILNSAEAAHDPTGRVLGLLTDLGWTAGTPPPPVTPTTVDMMVNGSDGPITINKGDNLAITATIMAGQAGQADYWLVALYKGMFFSYDLAQKRWVPGQVVTFQGPLASLTDRLVFNGPIGAKGKITFFLGVDMTQDGVVSMGTLVFDSATVVVQ